MTGSGANVTIIPDPNDNTKMSRRLMGTLVASPFVAIDPEAPPSSHENARLGCFFNFQDLSCRQNGLYRLRFVLMCVGIEVAQDGGHPKFVATVDSDVFEVFSAKDFPGMTASTALTRELKRQGASVSVKKGNEGKGARKAKRKSGSDTDDSGSDSGEGKGSEAKTSSKKKKGRIG